MSTPAPLGLVLFTGGAGVRLGGRKASRPHPAGGSWSGHLLRTFQALSAGPVWVVGEPVVEAPELPRVDDPRMGPAVALRAWAQTRPIGANRWWVVACDQVRWTAADLERWRRLAEAADPQGLAWVMAQAEGIRQYFGSFLGATLVPRVAEAPDTALRGLADGLPTVVLELALPAWADIDTPAALEAFRAEQGLR